MEEHGHIGAPHIGMHSAYSVPVLRNDQEDCTVSVTRRQGFIRWGFHALCDISLTGTVRHRRLTWDIGQAPLYEVLLYLKGQCRTAKPPLTGRGGDRDCTETSI
jgi:hypothetical protein